MDYMFSNGFSLRFLDLSSFTMEKMSDITYMFNNTPNLEFINLTNAKPNQNIKINEIFKGTPKNLIICTNSEVISQKIDSSFCGFVSCSENWKEERKKNFCRY